MSFLMFRLFQFNFRKVGFLTFETVTLVPIQSKMIDPSLLSEKEVSSSLSFSRNSDLSTLNKRLSMVLYLSFKASGHYW